MAWAKSLAALVKTLGLPIALFKAFNSVAINFALASLWIASSAALSNASGLLRSP